MLSAYVSSTKTYYGPVGIGKVLSGNKTSMNLSFEALYLQDKHLCLPNIVIQVYKFCDFMFASADYEDLSESED